MANDVSFNICSGDLMVTIENQELRHYAECSGLNNHIEGRYSWFFVFNLIFLERVHGISPSHIIYEIRHLEDGSRPTRTKPEAQFMRTPLKGLWHKHYFSEHFILRNIRNHMTEPRVRAIVREVSSQNASHGDKVKALVHRITTGSIEERASSNQITGEWIVFAKHEGKNYYLCLTTHATDDERISENIRAACGLQFPFLSL